MLLERRFAKRIDYGLIIMAMALFAVGCLAVYSATRGIYASSPLYFVKRQVAWGVISLIAFVAMMTIDYRVWQRWVPMLYGVNLVLLLAVLFTAKEIGGSQRWFRIGGVGIQPSEFAKLVVIITVARFLHQRDPKDLKVLAGTFLVVLPPMVLVLRQPDLGTALVFIAIVLGMLYLGGAKLKHLGVIVLVGGLFAVLGTVASLQGWVEILDDYQLKRILAFLDPWEDPTDTGWNVIQSMIAVGSGGFAGQGYLQGSQTQLSFLPSHYTDFIFSVIGEEFGFLGAVVLLCLFLGLFLLLMRTIAKSQDRFGRLLVAGVLSMLGFHVVINVAMTIGLAPVTGIPLPFISYGGSSLLTNMLGLGMTASVYMRRDKLMLN
ncbi:MAG TPA: rod shape-determining protein RodA [Firmicutes bacterium]|nr:rod shape-determining protein RodA [Bacillota bacterium]